MTIPYIVLLNWRNADETIGCLDNLYSVEVPAKIVVLDNDSGDESVNRIAEHAERRGRKCIRLLENAIQENGVINEEFDLVLIENLANRGFAGGNNPGIRLAVAQPDCDIVWLLNNDARIDHNTLPPLRRRLLNDPSLGFVGSVVRYYHSPDTLQCFGGAIIYPGLGKSKHYKKGLSVENLSECSESEVDYVMGVSLAFPKKLVEDVGLMEEAYFMYCEEVDWQMRAIAKGWKIGVEPSSHVWHKESQSTQGRSHMFHYFLNRSAVMFAKKHYGISSLLTVVPSLLTIVLIQNWRAPLSLRYGWRGIWEGVNYHWQSDRDSPLVGTSRDQLCR